MKCPKCHADMASDSFSGQTVHCCTGCHGLWFTPDVFEILVKDDWLSSYVDIGSASEGARQDKIRRIRCPECGSAMGHVRDEDQDHILYEECPKGCGFYFDAGEFRDLAKTSFWDKFKTRKRLGRQQ